jgi:hypothetical protein
MRIIVVLTFLLLLPLLVAERGFTQGGDTASVKSAVERSLPLLQRIGPPFIEYTGCVSCHHNVLTAMAVELARERGFKVDQSLAQENRTATYGKAQKAREKLLYGRGMAGDATTVSYILLSLAASRAARQEHGRDGSLPAWRTSAGRVLEAGGLSPSYGVQRLYHDRRDRSRPATLRPEGACAGTCKAYCGG